MRKSKIFYLSLAIFLLANFSLFAQFAGGTGTEADPWQIATAQQLNNVRNYLGPIHSDKYFIQTADIDLGVAPWNQGEGWVPIAPSSYSAHFYGNFDGGSYQIVGLFINRPNSDYQALFGRTWNCTIKNVILQEINITGKNFTGGLVGDNNYSNMNNCSVSGNIACTNGDAGGLIGYCSDGIISDCSSSITITGDGKTGGLIGNKQSGSLSNSHSSCILQAKGYIGGLIGYLEHGSVSNCFCSGNISTSPLGYSTAGGIVGNLRFAYIENCHNLCVVSGTNSGGLAGDSNKGRIENSYNLANVYAAGKAGGLVGYNSRGSIICCYNAGSVFGESGTGGIAGHYYSSGGTDGGQISYCYNKGLVSGANYTGGLIGLTNIYGDVKQCYNIGLVNGGEHTGGLIGSTESSNIVQDSYWNIVNSGQTSSAGGDGRYTNQMVYPHSADTFVNWDWRIWKPDLDHSINGGYPYLRDPEEVATQAPEPAICIYPTHQELSIKTNVKLRWGTGFSASNSDSPTGFKLWLGSDNPPTNLYEGIDLGFQFSYYPDPILEPNTIYYWKIVPYNDIGEAENCPIWSFSTYNPSFSLIYPNGGESWQSGTTRTIRWSNNAPPEDFELYISYNFGNDWSYIATVDGSKGYYHYQAPSINSNACLLKIVRSADENDYDISDNPFSISNSSNLPKLVLTYPNANGIQLKVGDAAILSWTRQNINTISLDYSIDDGINWVQIISGINADSYSWVIPDILSNNCRIRVRSNTNPTVLDISDNAFSLSKLQVLFPSGGETFTSDYSNTYSAQVLWNAEAMHSVKIEYTDNGGSSWNLVANNIDVTLGIYEFILPGTPGSNYQFRICNTEFPSVFSLSGVFTLRNPIKIRNANGGGFITNNSLFNLRWQMQDIEPDKQIFWEYSTNNSDWTRINNNAVPVSAESMFWFVNIGLQNTVWFRAIEEGSERILTKSESSFRITDKSLSIFAPNGGETYPANSVQTIAWDYSGLTNLDILFSADDGENWTQVARNIPASALSYNWTVPEIYSDQCRIRLQDRTYSYMWLDSDLPFSIVPAQIIAPTVDFSADLLEGDIPLSVQFTSEIEPGTGDIASILWDFGDGNSSSQANPLHTYTEAGTYTVSLTVTNSFGGSTTETKEDYITALPNTPRIELISANSLNFGTVYLGDSSAPQVVKLKNIGTAPLTIQSLSFDLEESPFAVVDLELPLIVAVADSTQIELIFTPVYSGTVSDSLYIASDAVNTPLLAIKLSGRGEYVPPAAVEGLEVEIVGSDAILSWEPVTTTIYDTPIEPDGFIVLYNETPYEDEHFYYYLSFSTECNYLHYRVAQYRQQMFYRVVAVKDYREEVISYLRSLEQSRERMKWGEIKERIGAALRSADDR